MVKHPRMKSSSEMAQKQHQCQPFKPLSFVPRHLPDSPFPPAQPSCHQLKGTQHLIRAACVTHFDTEDGVSQPRDKDTSTSFLC